MSVFSRAKRKVKSKLNQVIEDLGLSVFLNKRRYGNLSPADLRALIGKKDPVILDIGANDGVDSRWLARVFPEGQVYSFEPDPRAIARFKAKIDQTQISLQEMALGAENGTMTFYQSSGWPTGAKPPSEGAEWDYSGSLRPPKEASIIHPWLKFDHEIKVPVSRLDAWASEKNIQIVDFIWADVQGAEGDLIMGGGAFIHTVKAIYIEFSNQEEYAGQWNLEKIKESLPKHKLMKVFAHDALFVLDEN
jgi:2-O-methyltransferase